MGSCWQSCIQCPPNRDSSRAPSGIGTRRLRTGIPPAILPAGCCLAIKPIETTTEAHSTAPLVMIVMIATRVLQVWRQERVVQRSTAQQWERAVQHSIA